MHVLCDLDWHRTTGENNSKALISYYLKTTRTWQISFGLLIKPEKASRTKIKKYMTPESINYKTNEMYQNGHKLYQYYKPWH